MGHSDPLLAVRMTYVVVRHGGRISDSWRQLYVGDDEQRATAIFERAQARLRHGTVELVRAGITLKRASAPTLRTRW